MYGCVARANVLDYAVVVVAFSPCPKYKWANCVLAGSFFLHTIFTCQSKLCACVYGSVCSESTCLMLSNSR